MNKVRATAVLAALAGSLSLAYPAALSAEAAGPAADSPCLLDRNVIRGTNGPDTIRGTSGNDVIASLGGDDVVLGMGGNDQICLGPGRDIGKGGDGIDSFISDPVLDGRDDFYGNRGPDSVRYLGRSVGVSVTLDGVANDGAPGERDNVRNSTENVQGTPFADKILGNDLDNDFIGGSGDDDLRGGLGADKLRGFDGDDLIIGNAGDDRLSGGDGDDRFVAAALPDGSDEIFGGDGFDVMSYEARNAGFGVTVVLNSAFDDGSTGEFDKVRTDVEGVFGGSGNDTLEAGAHTAGVSNHLAGGFGNDTLRTIDGKGDLADGGPGLDLCFTDGIDWVANCELP